MLPIERIRLFLFDMDGTLYLGERLYSFTKELLATIRAQGKTYMFMTNNSSKSVDGYIEKLARLGIAAEEGDFITSAQATADYLLRHHPREHFYVLGTRSLLTQFAEAGLDVTDVADDRITGIVAGYDTELTYRKLDDVSRMLSTKDLLYIATHPDTVCPTEYGFVPDCGAVCEMLYQATGKRPLVIGKPEPLMPQLAMQRVGVSPDETVVVGDRIYTDIECGLRADAHTILVFSGETTHADYEAAARKPETTMEDAGELLAMLKQLS
ncbi:MAG: HAD-IIA family hydrolase [Clostridia bacterium]|nr:HAD-IIA family hydrolase [Clostridia bacterium]